MYDVEYGYVTPDEISQRLNDASKRALVILSLAVMYLILELFHTAWLLENK